MNQVATPAAGLEEMRGVWIIDHSKSMVLKSPTNIANTLNFLQTNGFNTVFPAVWDRGLTAFPSEVMKRHGFPQQDPGYNGFDPLQEIVAQGKNRGMKVIPWFEYGFAASPALDGGHILQNKPQWSALDIAGNLVRHGNLTWMNSLDGSVQQFMLDLLLEVIQKYDVDGIQGDDRFPAMPFNAGYDANTRNLFQAQFGKNPPRNGKDKVWVKFRADLLTEYLRRIFNQVKTAKPSCIVSISPAPFPFGLENLMQDSDTWVRENLVDFLHPQFYRSSFASYQAEVDKLPQRFTDEQRKKIAPGIAFRANNVDLTSSDIVRSVQLNRKRGLAGEVFFFLEGLIKNNNQIAIALSSETNYKQLS